MVRRGGQRQDARTTHRVPWEMLAKERPHLGDLPDRATRWPGTASSTGRAPGYGVHWKWVGYTVQVSQRLGTVEVWAGDERIAVHPPGAAAWSTLHLAQQ